jgi:DNA-binding NarL/FixJ family response regulator
VSSARRRVVVADNDDDALDLAVTDLVLEGHEVVGTATQGDQAIELCLTHEPDVLVVDVRMPPGPDGVEVLRRLRHLQPGLRIIVYTNYRSAKLVRDVLRYGGIYLQKGQLGALRTAVKAVDAVDTAAWAVTTDVPGIA